MNKIHKSAKNPSKIKTVKWDRNEFGFIFFSRFLLFENAQFFLNSSVTFFVNLGFPLKKKKKRISEAILSCFRLLIIERNLMWWRCDEKREREWERDPWHLHLMHDSRKKSVALITNSAISSSKIVFSSFSHIFSSISIFRRIFVAIKICLRLGMTSTKSM